MSAPEPVILTITDSDFSSIFSQSKLGFSTIENPKERFEEAFSELEFTDVCQKSIGNCYFLSALGTIINQNKSHLRNIIQINDNNRAMVSFYAPEGNDTLFTYEIDCTTVLLRQSWFSSHPGNRHNNFIVDLIEKAFAIHRSIHSRPSLSEQEAEILDVMISHQFDRQQSILQIERQWPEKIARQASRFFDEVTKKHSCITMYEKALASGTANNALRALTGQKTGFEVIYKLDIEYILMHIMPKICLLKSNPLSPISPDGFIDIDKLDMTSMEDQTFIFALKTMFDDINNEACKDYIKNVQQEQYVQSSGAYYELQTQKAPLAAKCERLKKHFSDIPNLKPQTLQKTHQFVDAYLLRKRGMGRYNSTDLILYESIKTKLSQGQFVCLATRKSIGRNPKKDSIFSGESIYNGLAGSHSYQVIDCLEIDNLKFVVVRNPWGSYVRNYKRIETITAEGKASVLSAFGAEHYHPFYFKAHTPFDHTLGKPGVFLLELTDVSKRCMSVQFTMTAAKDAQINSDHPQFKQ